MPTVCKILTLMNDETDGFSEVHYWNDGSLTPNLGTIAASWITNVLPARLAIMPNMAKIVGVRISYRDPTRTRSWAQDFIMNGTQIAAGIPLTTSLDVRFRDSTSTAQKWVYVRPVPREVVTDDDYQPGGIAGFATALTNWINVLKAGPYGWLSVDPTQSLKGTLISYTRNVTGQITFTTAGADFATLVAGTRYTINVARFSHSKNSLNRSHVVMKVDASNVQTVNQVPALTWDNTTGTYRIRVTAFNAYASGDSMHLGRRNAGRAFFGSRGRRSALGLS